MTDIHIQFIFHGQVQGVGFRNQTFQAAEGLSIFGYVKNLSNGTVELRVEGSQEAIDKLLNRIQARMGPFIERVEEQTRDFQNFEDFRIERDS